MSQLRVRPHKVTTLVAALEFEQRCTGILLGLEARPSQNRSFLVKGRCSTLDRCGSDRIEREHVGPVACHLNNLIENRISVQTQKGLVDHCLLPVHTFECGVRAINNRNQRLQTLVGLLAAASLLDDDRHAPAL